uniref:Uncharacterized protein n=1 Tax=Oryza punctata TaxID=4537 RepID=A0A0E0L0M1_ORYPU
MTLTPWRLTAGGQRARLLRRRHYFGSQCWTPGSTFTSKEVFTWAKSNNQRLLNVGDIGRTNNYNIMGYIERKVVNVLLADYEV